MDDIVRQALAKWPNVPACYGWLMLDRRGNWRMRDEAVQRAGGLGSPVRHAALIAFIVRNYDVDERGQWYFQNGPQRVYIELEYTPFVVRLSQDAQADAALVLADQCGTRWEPQGCWVDDRGAVVFTGRVADDPRPRVGVLHDHDLDLFSDFVEDVVPGDAPPEFAWSKDHVLAMTSVRFDDVPARFGFVRSPAELADSPAS
ncbi:DUF2946 family protein [Pararobbsia alpina]|uniref:DUF2946 family protein n=1 Tax=Pararobbsia alpina TaxID=621374 RepID=UPI0039A4B707